MNRASPETRVWGQCIIAYEAEVIDTPEPDSRMAFPVFEKLRPHLANLMGKIGVHALVLRAHTLALAEVPSLRVVQVDAAGGLERTAEPDGEVSRAQKAEGDVVLVARLLGLLVVFIGENLTVQIVGDVWPAFAPGNLPLQTGGKNEKTK